MEYFFRSVSGLGNVAVSRHAQARITADGIHPDAYTRALLEPTRPDVCEGADVLWRERDGLRIVVLTNPTANLGAVLVKTVALIGFRGGEASIGKRGWEALVREQKRA